MRLSLRFLVPLLVALALFAYAAVPLVDTLTTRWFVRDLDIRSNLIASTVAEPLADLIETGSTMAAHDLVEIETILPSRATFIVGPRALVERRAEVAGLVSRLSARVESPC